MSVTVIIPSLPKRQRLLTTAIGSVLTQERQPDRLAVAVDRHRFGAPKTRDQALEMVQTSWVAPLDDDDVLEKWHLRRLLEHADETGADLVYPWYTVDGGTDPFAQWENVPWDSARPHQVPVTMLVSTELLNDIGGWSYDWDPSQGADPGVDADGNRAGEDYRLILRAVEARAKIVHLPMRTWRWTHWIGNTSGLPSRVR